jgi:hypothetical protein
MKRKIIVGICFLILGFVYVNAQGISVVKPEEQSQLFSEKRGSVILNISNIMFTRMNTTSMPVVVNPQITVLPNFTVGPVFSYFKFLNSEQVAKSVTMVENVDIKYNQFMVGFRADYHFTHVIEKMVRKDFGKDYFDLYAGVWSGYSFTSSGHRLANAEVIKATQKLRSGVHVGVRSMIVPRFGLFMEVGYSSYGIGSFGCTIRFDNPKKANSSSSSFAKKKSPYKAIVNFNL